MVGVLMKFFMAKYNIAILWYGLPYYAANAIRCAKMEFPEHRFFIVSSKVGVPYTGIEETIGGEVHWVDEKKPVSWSVLGCAVPDLCVLTSWNHPAYMALAREAKASGNCTLVSMVDNYFHGSLKQWVGALYFRLRLRSFFDFMWVPGARSRRFMRFLGMPDNCIAECLYTADPVIFFPPLDLAKRRMVIFVGQFIRRKGVDNIVEALLSVRGAVYLPILRMIGHGPLAEDLRAAGMPVEAFMQAGELAEAYRQSSALLLPSTMDHWGVVAHEAALCGCFILATKQCGCVDDLVEHGVNGYIMEKSSADEIIKALNWHGSLSQDQVARGREISLTKASRFSPDRWAKTLASFQLISHSE